MSRVQLRQHLTHVHAPLCLAHDEVGGRFTRYVHHYVLDGYEQTLGAQLLPDRDVVTCIWFDNEMSMKASAASEAFQKFIRPDEDNFRELEGSMGFQAQEVTVTRASHPIERKLLVFRQVQGDASSVTARWADSLTVALRAAAPVPIESYTVNALRSAYSDSEFNQLDEIGYRASAELDSILDFYRTLAQREFKDQRCQMLVTEPKVFK